MLSIPFPFFKRVDQLEHLQELKTQITDITHRSDRMRGLEIQKFISY